MVLFVGGLDRARYFKGVDFLIEAWRDLSQTDIRLLIVIKVNSVHPQELKEDWLPNPASTGTRGNPTESLCPYLCNVFCPVGKRPHDKALFPEQSAGDESKSQRRSSFRPCCCLHEITKSSVALESRRPE